jgi:hypothetical protein
MSNINRLRLRALDAIENFNYKNRATNGESSESAQRDLYRADSASCAYLEAYAIMTGRSYDDVATDLHREARIKELGLQIHDVEASPRKPTYEDLKSFREWKAEFVRLMAERRAENGA